MAGLEPGEAGPVGAEGGRFSVSPVNGDRPGNLLMQKESSDMGRSGRSAGNLWCMAVRRPIQYGHM